MDIMQELTEFSKKPLYEQVRIVVDECNAEEGDNYVPCDVCHGKGYYYIQDGNRYERIPCKCSASRDALRYVEAMGYLDTVKRCRFDTFEAYDEATRSMLEICVKYAQNPKGWLFMGGQSGCGKTHLAFAIFGRLIHKHYSPKIMLWIQDSQRIKAGVNSPEYDRLVERYQDADVLIIDDLFNTEPTVADIKLARTILDGRYINNLPTIITSEMTLSTMNEVDDAITGRIAERCGSNLIQMAPNAGRNYRCRNIIAEK